MLDNCSNSGIINKEDMRQLEDMKGKQKKIRTFRQLYPEWLEFKSVHTNSTSYLNRISLDWFKYYDADMDGLIDRPLKELTQLELDRWAHKKIQQYDMTKKQYYNMSVILRQGLEYALQAGYIERNPFRDVKINTKMFRRCKKKPDNEEVFLTDEQPLIEEEMYRRFREEPQNTAPLAVLLDFQIGVRVGEIVALKETDIEGSYIHVQREEVGDFRLLEDRVTFRQKGVKVVDYTKSDAGNRLVYLTEKARKIIQMILDANQKNKESCGTFLFVKDGKRLKESERL